MTAQPTANKTCTDSAWLSACSAEVVETQLLGCVPRCPGSLCWKLTQLVGAPMVASTLSIIPNELSFPFELRKIVTSTLTLCNTSVNKIAYRIKPTNPMRYGVQPSSGFVGAGSTTAILDILQKHQAYPLEFADCSWFSESAFSLKLTRSQAQGSTLWLVVRYMLCGYVSDSRQIRTVLQPQ